ncbi:MAG: hypothetical protein OEW60_08665 [Thiovulaceae bacterium]|nr:hypothetical protein [Sulfurimonadaceae bacterium]
MTSPTIAQEGIKRAWRLACMHEKIEKNKPKKLPLLFAIDGMLKIKDGFLYTLDCKNKNSPSYADGFCAGDIGCSSGCAGDSNGFFEHSDSSGSSGSDCGGGCGGD